VLEKCALFDYALVLNHDDPPNDPAADLYWIECGQHIPASVFSSPPRLSGFLALFSKPLDSAVCVIVHTLFRYIC
jgi:hypothetical protein